MKKNTVSQFAHKLVLFFVLLGLIFQTGFFSAEAASSYSPLQDGCFGCDDYPDQINIAARPHPFRGAWKSGILEDSSDIDWIKVVFDLESVKYDFELESSQTSTVQMQIFDANGNTILGTTTIGNPFTIDNQNSGQVYFLKIFSSGESGSYRFRIIPQFGLYPIVALADDNPQITLYEPGWYDKTLFYMSGSVHEIGTTVFIDLADYARVTTEGQNGWITMWGNFDLSIGVDFDTIPVDAGFQEFNTSGLPDYGDENITGAKLHSLSTPFFSFTLLDSDSQYYNGHNYYFGQPTNLNFSYSFISTSFTYAKTEISREYLDNSILSRFKNPSQIGKYELIELLFEAIFDTDGSLRDTAVVREATLSDFWIDENLPTVDIVSPNTGNTFFPGDVVNVQASASDNVDVSYVDFYIYEISGIAGNSHIPIYRDSDGTNGWTYQWNTDNWVSGNYIVTAEVSDCYGNYSNDSSEIELLSNHEFTLSNPQILPGSVGDPSTQFTFKVTYTDADNEPPDSVWVTVNGTEIPLSATNIDYASGVVYSSSPRTFNEGTYIYSFKAIQGSIEKTTNNFIFDVYDEVTGHDLTLHTVELSRSSAEPGDSVTIRAQVNNNGIYTENNIEIDVNISGPGGYQWSDSLNIGTLGPSGSGTSIWGKGDVTTWNIPSNATMGDYQINVTVSSPSGDENWSDNTIIRSIRVSDQDPAYAAYAYRDYEIEWTSNHPADYYPGDLMGPLNTTYNGNNYQMYVHKGASTFRIHLEKNGAMLIGIFDEEYDYDVGYYEDNDDIFFAVDFRTDNFIWMRAGHPVTGASMTPAEQTITMGETGTFIAHIPCSSCSYGSSDPTVFEGNNSARFVLKDFYPQRSGLKCDYLNFLAPPFDYPAVDD